MPITYVLNGKEMTADALAEYAKRQPRPIKSTGSSVSANAPEHERWRHLGFVVEGYSIEMLADARADHEKAVARYPADCAAAEQAKQQKPKNPGEWSEESWMSAHKPHKVRAKPFEIESAAMQLADMARKAGWKRVTVSALKREKK